MSRNERALDSYATSRDSGTSAPLVGLSPLVMVTVWPASMARSTRRRILAMGTITAVPSGRPTATDCIAAVTAMPTTRCGASPWSDDRNAYTEAKSPFIEQVLAASP